MHPLIVTLRLDDESSQFFDRLRREHFPIERNFLTAHVTLFHALPAACLADAEAGLAEVSGLQPGFPVAVNGLRFLGRGVAYALAAPELSALHAGLVSRWRPLLSAQDSQKLSPHVTVQNKVASEAARRLFETLRAGFSPWQAQAVGLDLWEYQGGPWEFLRFFPFAAGGTRAEGG